MSVPNHPHQAPSGNWQQQAPYQGYPAQYQAQHQHPPNAQYPHGAQYPQPAGWPVAPQQPRRKRTALIVTLVLALVLAVGGATTFFVLRARHAGGAGDSGADWSAAWLDGFEQTWTLDPPSGLGGDISVDMVGGRLVRTNSGPDASTISVYSLERDTPELIWEEEFDVSLPWLPEWGNWLIVGDSLIDVETAERTDAPWDATAEVTAGQDGAIACQETTCTLWGSPTDKKWETTIQANAPVRAHIGTKVGNYILASTTDSRGKDTEHFTIDLGSGDSHPLDTEGTSMSPYPLADGWLIYGTGSRGAASTVGIYEPNGAPQETFSSSLPDATTFPWSPEPFTVAESKKWFQDGDTSWAPATYSVDTQDPECQTILVQDKEVTLGPDNSITDDERGSCGATSPIQAVYHSGDGGDIATFHSGEIGKKDLHLVEMTTGRASEPIPLGDYGSYLHWGDDRLLVHSDNGTITAYRATGS